METNNLVHYSGVFNNNELDKIVNMEKDLEFFDGQVGAEKNKPKKRITTIAWLHPNVATQWIYIKVAKLFTTYLVETLQSFQYSIYKETGHYKWHKDTGTADEMQRARVATAILQLSEPEDYMGGILEVKLPRSLTSRVIKVEKERGMVSIFPAGWKHRVTPVTKGIRKTLVMWGLKGVINC